MGLGKTLTMLALIISSAEHLPSAHTFKPAYDWKKPTLIVTPLSRESSILSWNFNMLRGDHSPFLVGRADREVFISSKISNANANILRHIHSQSIRWCTNHGPSRSQSADLMTFDIVLTTYDIVASESAENGRIGSIKVPGVLETYDWHRLVLDEGKQCEDIWDHADHDLSFIAHTIRNALSKRHRALLRLKARHRWCLTGTPVFNQIQDLYALLKFLRVYPFDSLSYFNTHIVRPLKTDEEKGLQRLKKLFRCVALRRTKDAVMNELELPPRRTRVHIVAFSPVEYEMYRNLRKSLSCFFNRPRTETDKGGSTCGVLPTITRLRRFCDHNLDLLPQDIRTLMEEFADGEELAQALVKNQNTCDVCNMEPSSNGIDDVALESFQCGHSICSRCLWVQSASHQSCSLCFGLEASQTSSRESDHGQPRDAYDLYQPSSKVLAMLGNIFAEQAAEPGSKWYAGS